MSAADSLRRPLSHRSAASSFGRRIVRLLYTQNPFYLLSVCFVLHGTGLWFHGGSGPMSPWPLMGLTCGYILMMAVTAFAIVRFGRVWDDARSIFFIILLLFVQLSLTFDDTLISAPATGRALLIAGLVFSLAITEFLLIGLRMRLPLLFRGPFYLLLALLFLYPLGLLPGVVSSETELSWRIFLFSPVAALAVLTLIPAVRRGPAYVAENGTPWVWPWYPWSLFAFLGLCLGLRAYALSLSFDPVLGLSLEAAMRLETAFGGYFLVPLLLSIAVLLLEMSRATPSRSLERAALMLPLICLWLALPPERPSIPYADFLSQFTAALGSPLWLTVWSAVLFYGYCLARRVRLAEELLTAALLLAAMLRVQTPDLTTLESPQPLILWGTAILLTVTGVRSADSRRLLMASLCVVLGLMFGPWSDWPSMLRNVSAAHAVGVAVLVIGLFGRDAWALLLRRVIPAMLIAAAMLAAAGAEPVSAGFPAWSVPAYLGLLLSVALLVAWRLRDWRSVGTAAALALVAAARLSFDFAVYVRTTTGWEGIGAFLFGLFWFAVAVLISVYKALHMPSRSGLSEPPKP